jgi:hypothetical protein
LSPLIAAAVIPSMTFTWGWMVVFMSLVLSWLPLRRPRIGRYGESHRQPSGESSNSR